MVDVLVGGKKREDVLEERLQQVRNQKHESDQTPPIGHTPDFSIEEHPTFWRIKGVPHFDYKIQVDMARDVISDVSSGLSPINLDLAGWIEHNDLERNFRSPQFDGFTVCTAEVYMKTWNTLRIHQHHPRFRPLVESARLELTQILRAQHQLQTITTIEYNPPWNQDFVYTHEVKGSQFGRSPDQKIPGPHYSILPSSPNIGSVLELIFGIGRDEIYAVAQWLYSATPTFCREQTPPPIHKETRCVTYRLLEKSGDLILNGCSENSPRPALGLRLSEITKDGGEQ